ncbi:hypothetical protein QR680_013464 [Steinernema hermaphroditum]|uniref:Tyrosine-protein phosphatase domain-containing protein n=1 Tax=Steinernema hermaphroditum TaxID=289476 RepID=A0AA39M2B6_9BILA|nr:hypothetical protein QR680_013464 [Steinernema hermaphroditum]
MPRKESSPQKGNDHHGTSGYTTSGSPRNGDKPALEDDEKPQKQSEVAEDRDATGNQGTSGSKYAAETAQTTVKSSFLGSDSKEEFSEQTQKMIEEWMENISKVGIRGIREEFIKEKRTILPSMPYEAFNENEARNRYDDVLLLDHSRVKLQNKDDDYIHASLLNISDGYSFICAQAPMSNTCGYFYRMAIEQQCNVIVMLCDFREKTFMKSDNAKAKSKSRSVSKTATRSKDRDDEEGGRHVKVEKSYDYVPQEEGDFLVFGALTVRNRKTRNVGGTKGNRELEKIIQRELEITDVRTKKVSTITHLHYLTWPDHRVPASPFTSLEVCRIARYLAKSKPVLVHCSAGIGRTGTLTLVEMALHRMMKPDRSQTTFRMVDALNDIRNARWHSVQNDQYVFAHRCVIEQLVEFGALTKSQRVSKFITDHDNFVKRKNAEHGLKPRKPA